MSNRRDIQFTYNPHNKATILDCSFVVDSANGNGLGIRSLKNSGRIANVYMHTSATPAAGNPNPQAGVIVVQLQDNYNRLLSAFGGRVVPVGSSISMDASDALLTIGNAYVITNLGAATAANWITLGVPANITPAVGVAFIAAATGAGTDTTAKVAPPAATGTGIFSIDAIGDANLANSNGAYTSGNSNGMQIVLGCYKANSSGATPLLAAPADNSVISLVLYLNNSAQGV